jgi:glycosyltransferase involved in cell wall biosynthesis
MREIWVAGYPSFVGGADTELDHLIDLWRTHGVAVNLVPMFGCHAAMRAHCDERGCTTHEYRPDIFADKIVISLCNGEFLTELARIAEQGRPRLVLWANCMTYVFDAELEAHDRGLIDFHLFQSDYQRRRLCPELESIREVRALDGYRPFFNLANRAQDLSRHDRPPDDYFGVGRISRDDGSKFHPETWMMLAKVSAPRPVKAFMLGFGDNAAEQCGQQPPCGWLDWMTWTPDTIPARELYRRIHVLMHLTGGSRENWPRVVLEAWASGVVPVVDDDFGVAEMVTDGHDGFRVRSVDEAAFRASQLAFDEPLRLRMAENGYRTLLREHANPVRCFAPFQKLWNAVPLAQALPCAS